MESKLTIEGLEKERDFYFGKLRDIEVMAQEHENDGGEFVQKVLGILYATEVRIWARTFATSYVTCALLFRRDSRFPRMRKAFHLLRRKSTKEKRPFLTTRREKTSLPLSFNHIAPSPYDIRDSF